jgi:hypothetical protein
MKKILLLGCVFTLLTTTGCLVSERRERHDHGYYRGHDRYERRAEVEVGPPVVVVRPPEIIVR